MNIRIKIEYDGNRYYGYQIQPHLKTIESELKNAIEKTVLHDVKLYSAGRTDKGVHAFGQIANFHSNTTIDLGNLPKVINLHLPEDISVIEAKHVSDEFHSRFDAKYKQYRYIIYKGKYRNPFYNMRSYHFPYHLNLNKMKESFKYLIGTHDFKSFIGRHAVVKDTIRTIYKINIKETNEFIFIDFYGKSFLKNMIRIIIGTALEIGRGKKDTKFMKIALESKSRKKAGPTALSHGLYLMNIFY